MAESAAEGAVSKNTGHVERTPSAQPGKWTELGEAMGWKTAAAALRSDLTAAQKGRSVLNGEPDTEVTQSGGHASLEMVTADVRVLLERGTVSDRADAWVTKTELLDAAADVWGLDKRETEELRDRILPDAEKWHAEQVAKGEEHLDAYIEDDNRTIIETWGRSRFEVLLEQVLPHVTSPDIKIILAQFAHADLAQVLNAATTALQIDSTGERSTSIQNATDAILDLASRLTRMHPDEIRRIARNEHDPKFGFLFLDSLGPQWPILDETYEAGERFYNGEEATAGEAVKKRAAALGQLKYGAPNTHSIQGYESYINGEGAKIPGYN